MWLVWMKNLIFNLILINLNLSSYTRLMATIWDSALEYSIKENEDIYKPARWTFLSQTIVKIK